MLEKSIIKVENEQFLKESGEVTLHFTYDRNLTLKELTEVLDMTNKAINDFNRDNGVKSGYTLSKRFAPEVTGVKEGSVIVQLLTTFAVGVSTGVIGNYIYDRLKTWGAKKKEDSSDNTPTTVAEENVLAKYPVSITVNGGTIDIHIHNESVA